jgi:hypothetical protein
LSLIPEELERDVLIYAFRYALGRANRATEVMSRAIKHAWPNLSQPDKIYIHAEIKQADKFKGLGSGADEQNWLEILELEL